MEFFSRFPLFLFPVQHFITTKLWKSKSSKPQTPTSTIIKCCHVDMFSMYACVKMSGVPVSHTDTSPHAVCGRRQTHTYTCKHTQARPSLPNPPILQYTASVLLQFVCRIVGGWCFVCSLGEKSEGERQMVRRSEEKEKTEVAGCSSAGQSHSVDDLLQLAPQSLSPRLLVPLQSRQDLKIESERGQRILQKCTLLLSKHGGILPNTRRSASHITHTNVCCFI